MGLALHTLAYTFFSGWKFRVERDAVIDLLDIAFEVLGQAIINFLADVFKCLRL